MSDALHPIQVVVDRTGLSAHVIRVWERRYGVVTPQRTDTNRRLYSDEEIERLRLLGKLSESGHGIGYVAKLPTEKLRTLAQDIPDAPKPAVRVAASTPVALLADALVAVQLLDAAGLEKTLTQGEVVLGNQGVLQRLVSPLAQAIGERWRDGTLTAAHEHFATGIIRMFLGQAARSFAGGASGPAIVVVTPAGQLHELGALLVGATAVNLGWRVIYLGVSLPAAEIAGAALQHGARAVALSIVYPEDDANMPQELTRLAERLPETTIIAGGRAAAAYRGVLDTIGARFVADLVELGAVLDQLRAAGTSLAKVAGTVAR